MWLQKSFLSTTGSSIHPKPAYASKIPCENTLLLLLKCISVGVMEGSSSVSASNHIYFTLLKLENKKRKIWVTKQFRETSILSSNTVLLDNFILSWFSSAFWFRFFLLYRNDLLQWKLSSIKISTVLLFEKHLLWPYA